MKRLTILLMMGWALLGVGTAAEKPLRIYLPAEVQLEGELVELGCVGILLGDASLVEKAKAIQVGAFAVGGQVLVVDRNTILSRLASNGIRAHQVQILGAQTVRIGRHEMMLTAERIIDCARRYLDAKLAEIKGVTLTVIRPPQPQVLTSDAGAAELTVTEDNQQGGGIRKIRVAILQNGKQIVGEDVFFSVRYPNRRVVAAVELPAGTALTSENVRVETVESDKPEPSDWVVPYGMITRQRIAEGTAVLDTLLEPKQEPMVIRRRQNVLVRIDTGILFISAPGEAMDDGRVGELVRVKRGDRSQERIIICRVQPDGSVEPVL